MCCLWKKKRVVKLTVKDFEDFEDFEEQKEEELAQEVTFEDDNKGVTV